MSPKKLPSFNVATSQLVYQIGY